MTTTLTDLTCPDRCLAWRHRGAGEHMDRAERRTPAPVIENPTTPAEMAALLLVEHVKGERDTARAEVSRLRIVHDDLADVVDALVPESWRRGVEPFGECAGGSCDIADGEYGPVPDACLLHRLQQGQDYDVRETTT